MLICGLKYCITSSVSQDGHLARINEKTSKLTRSLSWNYQSAAEIIIFDEA